MRVIVILALVLLTSCACNKKDNKPLSAEFSYKLLSGDSTNFVRFTDITRGDYILSEWNFGDGTKVTNKVSVSRYYPFAGEYQVTLAVYSIAESDSNTKTISIPLNDLIVDFSLAIADTNVNYVRLVNNSSSLDSLTWSFNNRSVRNEDPVMAYFPFTGTYPITLKGFKNGVSAETVKSVNIVRNDPGFLKTFTLVWNDEFDGSGIDMNNWTFETGASGWGNNELQNYTSSGNAEIADGKLIITARKVNDLKAVGSYTSARMVTRNKRTFTYGRMEIRAKLPSGTGIWPAIWMLGNNIGSVGWPKCGEIDIMEYVGYMPNTVHATTHTESASGGNATGTSIPLATCEEEFHNYGIVWTERYIQFYIDDPSNITFTYQPPVKTESNWPFNKPQFFILNIAVGGNWGGLQGIDNSIFPQSMEIDYIRVYQPINY
ncbi:MAG: glycosyl hydrolase family protein [Bacteroidetes bacterium]|nr:glycosyl hydrolase family protein [Bacteroidota bacterium]